MLLGKRKKRIKKQEAKERITAKSYRSNTADGDMRGNKAAAVIYSILDSGEG